MGSSQPGVFLQASGTAVPSTCLWTEELIREHGSILSTDLVGTIRRMGVEKRHVAMANAAEFLTGRDQEMVLDETATTLAVAALRRCLDGTTDPDDPKLGLLIAVTNTQARLLPGLAPEMVAAAPDLLSSSIRLINLQGQGCSALQKAVEVAGWYLASNPDHRVAVVASEANSAYAPRVTDDRYLSFREIASAAPGELDWPTELAKTGALVQNFLFGDGAAALLLGSRETSVEFGELRHLTNLKPADQELVRIDGGGSRAPRLDGDGRPRFSLEPSVLRSGPDYVVRLVRALLDSGALGVADVDALAPLLMHTGSKKLLDLVCRELGIDRTSPSIAASYATLKRYGNLSSASIGFMLAEGQFEPGVGLMAGFGAGFSATGGVLRFR